MTRTVAIYAAAAVAAVTLLAGCRGGATELAYIPATGGNPATGAAVIERYGCGSCHMIPGIKGARGLVGPPLLLFARRTYIAGELPNSEENLIRWIRDPQSVEPGTAMPTLGLREDEARNAAAYLYTLMTEPRGEALWR